MWNNAKTLLLMAFLTGLFVAVGWALGGERMALYGLVFAALTNVVTYFFSDKIVLRMYRAQSVSREEAPELYEIVERLSRKAGLPMPKVAILPQDQPNAFATGRSPGHAVVAATRGILQLLTPEELAAVIAHELAHVKHRDMLIGTVAATLAGALSIVARSALWFGGGRNRDGGGNPLGLVAIILAPIAAVLIQLAISRSREFHADATGARIAGQPWGLAKALEKLEVVSKAVPMHATPATAHLFIVNPLTGGGWMTLFMTHPPVSERVARLRALAGFQAR
jgi:heat shock protein HtpX